MIIKLKIQCMTVNPNIWIAFCCILNDIVYAAQLPIIPTQSYIDVVISYYSNSISVYTTIIWPYNYVEAMACEYWCSNYYDECM
ncbi:hypothetical protein BDF19DRAFT_451823 [Syncephalis fuscata]|nr:hypothetical protein BDF19DRAFT_451823 [Syncephalis fuscata]